MKGESLALVGVCGWELERKAPPVLPVLDAVSILSLVNIFSPLRGGVKVPSSYNLKKRMIFSESIEIKYVL